MKTQEVPHMPTTWKRNRMVHRVTALRYADTSSEIRSGKHVFRFPKTTYTFRIACSSDDQLVDDIRAFKPQRPVSCLNCIAT